MNLDGSIKKYKVRYVVRGFEQRFGHDYTETWASVIKSNSYKVLMAKTAAEDWADGRGACLSPWPVG